MYVYSAYEKEWLVSELMDLKTLDCNTQSFQKLLAEGF